MLPSDALIRMLMSDQSLSADAFSLPCCGPLAAAGAPKKVAAKRRKHQGEVAAAFPLKCTWQLTLEAIRYA